MSLEFLVQQDNGDNALGSSMIGNSDDLTHKFRGPVKFTHQVDPLDEGDNTVKPPTLGSQNLEQLPLSSLTPLPIKEVRKKSVLFNVSPPDSILEEHKLVNASRQDELRNSKEIMSFGQTQQTQNNQVKNFIKLVLAKSYFNRFVDNMLTKAYVKKSYHFTQFQNIMMDDLRYIDQQHKSSKQLFNLLCKRLKIFPILNQSSYLVIGWQIIHILTILLILFWTPFNISFGITYDQIVFNNITVKEVEIYFLITIIFDALIVLNTNIIEKGVIIKSRRKIFLNYLDGQALYDVVYYFILQELSFASLLVAFQFVIDSSKERLGWQFIPYCIYYCCRLFKLQGRVHKLEEFFNITNSIQDFIELTKLLFIVVYVGHLFACLWHGVAFYQQGDVITWLDTYLTNQEKDTVSIYSCSFYWAVQTMITVGYGDLTPQNNYERLCANISMLLACGVYAFSFNSIGLMLTNLNFKQQIYKKSTTLLNQYLTKNQIKIELQSRIRNYYDYIFQEEQEINDEEITQITTKLSTSLQEELNFEIRLNVMKTNKVLTKFSQLTLKHLSLQIEEVRFSPEDQIILQDTVDDCSLYILTKGTVSIQFQDDSNGRNTRTLSYLQKGQSFGEYSFFTGFPRTASAKSIGFSRAYKIRRQQLLNILQQYPIDKERFCEVKDSILLSNNYQPAKLKCYSCDKFTHLIKTCPVLHYEADQERVIKKEYYPQLQERDTLKKRNRNSRHYYSALLEMKKTMTMIRDWQTKLALDNVEVLSDELGVSYDDDNEQDISPQDQEYSSLSKSLSKISRQQSQNRSYSQDNHLQPIQESDSNESVSISPNKPARVKQVKQTLQTAGFGITESLHNKLVSIQEERQETEQQNTSKQDDHRFTLKDSLGLPSPNEIVRAPAKRITLIKKQRIEDNYTPISSQTQVETRERGQSIQNQIKRKGMREYNQIREQSQEIQIYPSTQSVERREQLRRKTTKTNRSKTAKTLKSMKIQDNHTHTQNRELSIPVYEVSAISMELEEFEALKNYQYYFSWNNEKVVVARFQRIQKINFEKRRNFGNIFSDYTFNNLALNKALRIKRKLKLLDEPTIEPVSGKKLHIASRSPKPHGRKSTKRNTETQQDFLLSGIKVRKPKFGTQIQVQGLQFNKQNPNDFEFK